MGKNKNTTGKKKISGKRIALIVSFAVVLLLAVVVVSYFTTGIHKAEDGVQAYFNKTDEGVTVKYIDEGVFIDSEATDKAVIYYPGCKVEYTAYIPFCYELAKKGYDVFILEVKLNFALLDKKAGQKILDKYEYDKWILMGHSMGGIAISAFAEEAGDKVQGLVLLGAHGTSNLTDTDIKTLVLYGSEDGVVQRKKVEAGKKLLAKEGNYFELEIQGGNHAYWGFYGTQAMDGTATISRDAQMAIGIDEITRLFD